MSQAAPLRIDVTIRRSGQHYGRVTLDHTPATIGRDPTADICLPSRHVSRLHATLYIEAEGVRLVDAGSTNGFSLGGKRRNEAQLAPGQVVTLCDFELAYRVTGRLQAKRPAPVHASERSAPAPRDDGWDDWDDEPEDGRPEITASRLPTLPPEPTPQSQVDAPAGSLLNRLAYRNETFERSGTADDDDDDDDSQAPDLPPLVVTLHEEANALLYGRQDGEVAVEVIVVTGGLIHDVALLPPGHSYWWGGRPRGLERLYITSTAQRFAMVTNLGRGDFRAYVPHDPRWKMFHRGQRPLDVHRVGNLVGCSGELGDQLELTYGPFAIYVRCVRAPCAVPRHFPWRRLRPTRVLLTALLVSATVHGALAAVMPTESLLPKLRLPGPPADAYVSVALPPAPVKVELEPPPPQQPPEPKPPAKKRGSPEPALQVQPKARGHHWHPKPLQLKMPPPPKPSNQPPPKPHPPPAVSVSNFKVVGMIGSMPALALDSEDGHGIRGGSSILRGDPAPPGLFTKSGKDLDIRPTGRIGGGAVRRVVNRHADSIASCYHEALHTDPTMQGRLDVQWIIGRRGRVGGVKILYDGIGSATLSRCVRDVVHRWRFPHPHGGAATVTFPFRFVNPRL